MAKLIQVISTDDCRGLGRDNDDPVRSVRQLFDVDGTLLMERDDWLQSHYTESFARLAESLQTLEQEIKRDGGPRPDILQAAIIYAKAMIPNRFRCGLIDPRSRET